MNARGAVNVRGIVTLVLLLAAADLTVAYGLAPIVGRAAQGAANRLAGARVQIGTVRLHPLLLSFTVKDLRVFDPDDASLKIFDAGTVHARLDAVELLRRRVAFAEISADGVQAEIVRDASGEFNIEKLGAREERKGPGDLLKRFTDNRDWFRKIYEGIRKSQANKKAEKAKREVTRKNAVELPRGTLVRFGKGPQNLFEARKVSLRGATLVLNDKGNRLPPFRDVNARIDRLVLGPLGEPSFRSLELSGDFETSRKGSFRVAVDETAERTKSEVRLKDMDLAPLAPFYEKSLPVSFRRGYLTLDHTGSVQAEKLASENRLKIEGHEITADKKFAVFGAGPVEAVTAALNSRPSFEMQFTIGGDPEKPSFDGFRQSLMKLVGDDLQGAATKTLKEKAGSAVSGFLDKLKQQ